MHRWSRIPHIRSANRKSNIKQILHEFYWDQSRGCGRRGASWRSHTKVSELGEKFLFLQRAHFKGRWQEKAEHCFNHMVGFRFGHLLAIGMRTKEHSSAQLLWRMDRFTWTLQCEFEEPSNFHFLIKIHILYSLMDSFQMWTGVSRRIPFSMALKLVGIHFIGRPHSGRDDSFNLARLASKMKRAGVPLQITSCN